MFKNKSTNEQLIIQVQEIIDNDYDFSINKHKKVESIENEIQVKSV